MDELVRIIVGFVLTTLLGGLLGTYLQRRTWDHQNEARLREEGLRRAGEICQSVSGLLDKRRYRMQRLHYALTRQVREGKAEELLAEKMKDYDQVLYEWNDSFYTNRAMVGTYFGLEARDRLDELYQAYQRLGIGLEGAYRAVTNGGTPAALEELSGQFGTITTKTYLLNELMMTWLREGTVGRRAGRPLNPPEP